MKRKTGSGKYETGERKPGWVQYLIFVMFDIQLREMLLVLISVFAVVSGSVSVYLSWKHGLIQVSGITLIPVLLLLPGVASVLFTAVSEVARIYRRHIKDSDTSIRREDSIPVLKVPLTEIHVDQSDKDAGFAPFLVDIKGTKEVVFRSEKLDEYLWDNDIRIIEDSRAIDGVLRVIRSNAGNLLGMLHSEFLSSRRKKKQFHNESKLCLADDLRLGMKSVKCCRGSYYISFLTNEMCTRILFRNDEYQTVVFDGREYFPIILEGRTDKPVLSPMSQSQMGNHIGVGTIGFSKDWKLVLWTQSESALQSVNLDVGTGSGSSNWGDLSRNRSFRDALRNGMERELHEESTKNRAKVTKDLVEETMILGFYRWVRRGGKPEFVGISRLCVNAGDLEPNKAEVIAPRRKPRCFYVSSIDDLGNIIDKIRKDAQPSIPLEVNLQCLRHYLQKRKGRLNEFLFG